MCIHARSSAASLAPSAAGATGSAKRRGGQSECGVEWHARGVPHVRRRGAIRRVALGRQRRGRTARPIKSPATASPEIAATGRVADGAADGLDGEKKFITCEVRCGCHPTAGGDPTLDRGGQSEGIGGATTTRRLGGRHHLTGDTHRHLQLITQFSFRSDAIRGPWPWPRNVRVGKWAAFQLARLGAPGVPHHCAPLGGSDSSSFDRGDSAGPARHHLGDVAHVAFRAVYREQRKIGCPVRYSRKA